MRVREEKCDFFQSSVEYLGHVIDTKGLDTAPSKITAIVDAPPPQNVSQSFLELLNYYGRFIPNLASLLKPLHNLLCRGSMEVDSRLSGGFSKGKGCIDCIRGPNPLQTLASNSACLQRLSLWGRGSDLPHTAKCRGKANCFCIKNIKQGRDQLE